MMWLSIIGCMGLLLWTLYKEWSRPNQQWLIARLIATVIAITSLLLQIIPVRYTVSNKNNEQAVLLLTEGWDRDSLQAFMKDHKGARLYTTSAKPVLNETFVPDVSLVANSMRNLHVFGYGLKEDQLEALGKTSYIFHPALLKNTIRDIHWNTSVALGQALQVTGSYVNTSDHPVSIVLSAFATTLDSISLPAGQQSFFTLNAVPRQVGKAVYTIAVLNKKDTIEQEPLPIDAYSTKPLRLLLLASTPDFEQNFLKNWLASQGFSLAIRTGITSGKWNQEFINCASSSLSTISSSLLKQVDVVITDQQLLNHLSSGEKGSLENSIATGSVGLLVKTDSIQAPGSFYNRAFSITGVHDSVTHTLQLTIPVKTTTLPLATEAPLFINANDQLQPVIYDQQKHLLAAVALNGKGKIITTTINNSFSWQLSGHSDWYQQYWSALLNAASPQTRSDKTWSTSLLPRADEAMHIQVSDEHIPVSLQVGETLLAPAQDFQQDDQWNTTYWPRNRGWKTVVHNDQPSGSFYVFDRNDWNGVKRMERIQATKAKAATASTASNKSATTITEEKELSPIYFFLLFLFSAGFLWYEKKRHLG